MDTGRSGGALAHRAQARGRPPDDLRLGRRRVHGHRLADHRRRDAARGRPKRGSPSSFATGRRYRAALERPAATSRRSARPADRRGHRAARRDTPRRRRDPVRAAARGHDQERRQSALRRGVPEGAARLRGAFTSRTGQSASACGRRRRRAQDPARHRRLAHRAARPDPRYLLQIAALVGERFQADIVAAAASRDVRSVVDCSALASDVGHRHGAEGRASTCSPTPWRNRCCSRA